MIYYGLFLDFFKQCSLVTSLMYQLSLCVQLVEGNAVAVLLLRLLAPVNSLAWYQDYSGLLCLFLFPK
jgi:hypothetical protein